MCNNLAPNELLKYDWRIQRFADAVWDGKPLKVLTGGSVRVTIVEVIMKDGTHHRFLKGYSKDTFVKLMIQQQTQRNIAKILVEGWKNLEYVELSTSKLKKTKYFGGGFSRLAEEDRHLKLLQNHLDELGRIKIVGTPYFACGVRKVETSWSRADFEIYNDHGEPFFWISHKAGTSPKHFQQWSGVAAYREDDVVSEFISGVKTSFPAFTPKMSISKKLDPATPIYYKSVFGDDYFTKEFSSSNVHCVVGGEVTFVEIPNSSEYTLCTKESVVIPNSKWYGASYIPDKTSICSPEWSPTLLASYRNNMNSNGITNARFTISPAGGRKTKYELP